MTRLIRVPESVHEKTEELYEQSDYATYGETVRAVYQAAGHDV